MRRKRNNNGIFYVVISLFAIFSVLFTAITILYAQAVSQNINVAGDYNYYESENQPAPPETGELGAFPGGDILQPITFWDKINLGDGRNMTEHFYKEISFTDNTTTPVIWSSDDDGYNDFYLVDLWIENSSKATSSLRICVSTTTAGTLFGDDDATLLTDDNGTCTLLKTLSNAFGADGAAYDSETATSSIFGILQYPGTDNRIVVQTLGFLINSTTDIFVRATSTGTTYDAGLMGDDEFDGTLHIIGRESDR